MKDKELLELAAKAAEIEIKWEELHQCYWIALGQGIPVNIWNPLTDDGDALRLVVKLGMEIDIWKQRNQTIVSHFMLSQNHIIETSDDPYAATRRAIVRAAAEIGKAM